VSRSPCCFYSSTNAYADHSPNSRFHHEPDAKHRPQSQLEAAYHRADKAINQIVGLLAAA